MAKKLAHTFTLLHINNRHLDMSAEGQRARSWAGHLTGEHVEKWGMKRKTCEHWEKWMMALMGEVRIEGLINQSRDGKKKQA